MKGYHKTIITIIFFFCLIEITYFNDIATGKYLIKKSSIALPINVRHATGEQKEKKTDLTGVSNRGYYKPVNFSQYSIPSNEEVQSLYGDNIIILGLETCKKYKEQVPPKFRYIGTAGLFNTGTNYFYRLLRKNCYFEERWKSSNETRKRFSLEFDMEEEEASEESSEVFYGKKTGIRSSVPWWKHAPVAWRYENRKNNRYDSTFKKEYALPVLIIKDPAHWISSMCRNTYDIKFNRGRSKLGRNCPDFIRNGKNNSAYHHHHNNNNAIDDRSRVRKSAMAYKRYIERQKQRGHSNVQEKTHPAQNVANLHFSKRLPHKKPFHHGNNAADALPRSFTFKTPERQQRYLSQVLNHNKTEQTNSSKLQDEDEIPSYMRTVFTAPFRKVRRVTYKSIVHVWSEYYSDWLKENTTFPHLKIRYEDLLFHPQEVISQVCKCGGGILRSDFQFLKGDAKSHGSTVLKKNLQDSSSSAIIYGTKEIRDSIFKEDDANFVRKYLDKDVMRVFNYTMP